MLDFNIIFLFRSEVSGSDATDILNLHIQILLTNYVGLIQYC